jgi:GTP-binding protein EngB required for normal cell division
MNNLMNSQMNNGMMMNRMNAQMNNPMMNNLMNCQMNNGMMMNPMNAQMNNGMMMNPMNAQMNNGMMMTPRNEQMNNSMPNQMIKGMIEPPMNSQIISQMTSNLMNNGIGMNQMDSQMNNPMMSNLIMSQMNNNMMENQENLNNNIQSQIIERNNQIDDIIKNYPIENSSLVDSESTIKYYLYPNIIFTDEEYNNSKVLLIVGQSGHGKTTFINALVNIYLGITINDTFRYLLVLNENINQSQSITKEITIYKIRPKKGLNFPPLILIDTPGFGDTKGEEEDKKHFKQFKDFFESNLIKDVNCVLYIVNATNSRFGETDKRILNYLMNLFSKNLKENFVVWATHFTPENKKDIPNFIKTLSDEKHFYYQRVLKNEKLSREEIIKSCWYFGTDNKIICNNEIERN